MSVSWSEVFAELKAADQQAPLGPEDLERLAEAAMLSGHDVQAGDLLQRAHNAFLNAGDPEGAARNAIRLALFLFNAGQLAQGSGWIARAARLLDDGKRDCVETGYLHSAVALQSLRTGDVTRADSAWQQALEIAQRFRDADLLAMCRLGLGSSLIGRGQVEAGAGVLDEIMVSVTSGELTPITSGIVYCAVIETCRELFDLRRAQEWTGALTRWCESQPGLVAFRGNCLVYRTEIMELHGQWADAMVEAEKARELLLRPPAKPFAAAAAYEIAELHRLRGEFAKAEEAYRQSSQMGQAHMPGLARMRLAQGRAEQAASAIRRERDEAGDLNVRAEVLPAFVDIMLAIGEVAAASDGALELERVAALLKAPFLEAVAREARGSVLLAGGDPRGALQALRRASSVWRELDAPYDVARVRVLIARACRALGDSDTAGLELDAARRAFTELGAVPDLAALETRPRTASGLSAREVEVLRLVAAGKSNRAIAEKLVISDKTVARHVSNIFTKLGLSSRSAATAYAYEHGLN
jgi:ATP/maltotriose-dependent transcriptional regulator MalT